MSWAAFLKGVASIMDIGGTLNVHRRSHTFEDDARAIESDWQAVGQDMWAAIRECESEGRPNAPKPPD